MACVLTYDTVSQSLQHVWKHSAKTVTKYNYINKVQGETKHTLKNNKTGSTRSSTHSLNKRRTVLGKKVIAPSLDEARSGASVHRGRVLLLIPQIGDAEQTEVTAESSGSRAVTVTVSG